MSVLLCRQKARQPFETEKLNIRIWSEQELCYVIWHYPLLCFDHFLSEKLYLWIEQELQMKPLADRLRQSQAQGEPEENQLLSILQECNYYDVNEVRAFGQRMVEYKNHPAWELVRMEAQFLCRVGKFSLGYDKLCASNELMEQEISAAGEEPELEKLLKEKADILCDMAAVRLRMFDEAGALELLVQSEMTSPSARAQQMRYLINGAGNVSEEEKQVLDEEKAEAQETARDSRAYREVEALFEKDSVQIFREAAEIVRNWKNKYRGMS